MTANRRSSDQYYDWSDRQHRKRVHTRLAATEKAACGSIPVSGLGIDRFVDRTLQALRKTWVQVCSGPGAWTEVLPFGQSIRLDPAHGLCSLRVSSTGSGVCRELSPDSRYTQANQCYQPRTVATAATVDLLCERNSHNDTRWFCPRADPCGACRQHAPKLLCAPTSSRGAKQ